MRPNGDYDDAAKDYDARRFAARMSTAK